MTISPLTTKDTFESIATYIPPRQIPELRQVCKQWHTFICQDSIGAKYYLEYKNRFKYVKEVVSTEYTNYSRNKRWGGFKIGAAIYSACDRTLYKTLLNNNGELRIETKSTKRFEKDIKALISLCDGILVCTTENCYICDLDLTIDHIKKVDKPLNNIGIFKDIFYGFTYCYSNNDCFYRFNLKTFEDISRDDVCSEYPVKNFYQDNDNIYLSIAETVLYKLDAKSNKTGTFSGNFYQAQLLTNNKYLFAFKGRNIEVFDKNKNYFLMNLPSCSFLTIKQCPQILEENHRCDALSKFWAGDEYCFSVCKNSHLSVIDGQNLQLLSVNKWPENDQSIEFINLNTLIEENSIYYYRYNSINGVQEFVKVTFSSTQPNIELAKAI
ncbi:MAG: hypothetical protein JHC93_06525 [Parachlamydiales bacterium]|nr:hypothetical protein [Parachlamydiales bacterium]